MENKNVIIYLDDTTDIYKVLVTYDYIHFYSNVEIKTNLFLNYCIHVYEDKIFFKILKEKVYVNEYGRYSIYRNFGSLNIFKHETEELYDAEMRCMKISKLLS